MSLQDVWTGEQITNIKTKKKGLILQSRCCATKSFSLSFLSMVAVWLNLATGHFHLVQAHRVVVAGSSPRRPSPLVPLWPTRLPTPPISHPVPSWLQQGTRLASAVVFQSMIAYSEPTRSPQYQLLELGLTLI